MRVAAVAAAFTMGLGRLAAAQAPPASADLKLLTNGTGFNVDTPGFNKYVLEIFNHGPGRTSVPITLRVTLGRGLTFDHLTVAEWACVTEGQLLTCTTSQRLVPYTSWAFKLHVAVDREAVPIVSTTFTVEYPGDSNPSNNTSVRTTAVGPSAPRGPQPRPTATATATTAPAPVAPTATPDRPLPTEPASANVTDLMLRAITNSGLFVIGASGSYSLTVTNVGRQTTNAPQTVVATLPVGLSFLSASGDGWSCAAAGQVVTCVNAAPLAGHASSILTITVSVGREAYPSVTNRATLSYAADSNLVNNTASSRTAVRPPRPPRPPRPQVRFLSRPQH
jgi:hypothetical protein